MSKETDHIIKLIAFFALPPKARIDALVASGWAARRNLEYGGTCRQLLFELEETAIAINCYEPWWNVWETDTVVSELESLISLVLVVSDRFSDVEQRLFESVEAMETEPEWRLVWRLVVRIADLLNIAPSVDINYIPALICGGDGT